MFRCYLKENKLTKPGSKQFQNVIVWFIRSIDSFQHIPDIYVTNRFEKKKTNAQNCQCAKIPAHCYFNRRFGASPI